MTGDSGVAGEGEGEGGVGDLRRLLQTTVELAPGMKGAGVATESSLEEGMGSVMSEVEEYIMSRMLLVVGTITETISPVAVSSASRSGMAEDGSSDAS